MSYPTDLKYTKDHEWIRLDGDTGTVGITDFAQQQLGDVVYVELPEVGTQLTAGKVFGTIESVKAVSELYAPVSGEVVEVNTALKDRPDDVNLGKDNTFKQGIGQVVKGNDLNYPAEWRLSKAGRASQEPE